MAEKEGTNKDAPKRNESDVYDRQIRLWGAEAQVRRARVQERARL